MLFNKMNKSVIAFALGLAVLLFGAEASAQEIVPDIYTDPGLYPNRDYVNSHLNEYIDPFTGTLQFHQVDFFVPGNGGFDLKVIRSYNSALVDTVLTNFSYNLAGLGWNIHFGRVLKSGNSYACLKERLNK